MCVDTLLFRRVTSQAVIERQRSVTFTPGPVRLKKLLRLVKLALGYSTYVSFESVLAPHMMANRL